MRSLSLRLGEHGLALDLHQPGTHGPRRWPVEHSAGNNVKLAGVAGARHGRTLQFAHRERAFRRSPEDSPSPVPLMRLITWTTVNTMSPIMIAWIKNRAEETHQPIPENPTISRPFLLLKGSWAT